MTESQRQEHHYSCSIPDRSIKLHHVSNFDLNSNRNKKVFQQKQKMDVLYLFRPDLHMGLQPRPLSRAATESIGNVTKMDTS